MATDLVLDGRFAIEKRIGQGAWGEVFRARDRARGEALVAVKRLRGHLDDPVSRERFQREMRLLARVKSPYVVEHVADGVDERGAPYLVVEWLEGEDLGAWRRAGPLSAADVREVGRQAALGLEALHEAGIVHRDIKPSNLFVLLSPAGGLALKLIDLGVARGPAEATLTTAGTAIGTPSYMSPEQARGDEQITHHADLFSLGVVLFELIAGRKPFGGDDMLAVLVKIVVQEAPLLGRLVPGLPREVEALVARALAKEPAERFGSAAEMAEALVALPRFRVGDGSETGSADAPTAVGSTGVSATRERRVVTAVFAGVPRGPGAEGARDRFVHIMVEHGGVAHRLLSGDVVAVFGSSTTTGDEVRRAARAALRVGAALPEARVTVVTGRAVAGASGVSGGDEIERGARVLEAMRAGASPGVARIDDATARLLGEEFEVGGAPGALELRGGRTDSAATVGAPSGRAASPGSVRTLLGKPTPCVGRDREIAALEALFAECAAEPVARAVLVTGAAGAGKSRVRYELLERLAARGGPLLVLAGRGDSLTAGSPFGLIGPALRRFAGILDGEPLDAQRDKLAAAAGRNLPEAGRARVLELLGEIASVPSGAGGGHNRDAMLRGDLLRGAWEAFLDAECRVQPVVLVLEDLHWGDVPSVKLVDSALRNLPDRPLFVVALARPEVTEKFPDLWVERDVQTVRLGALTRKASERLVREALGDGVPAATVGGILDRAEGNAFFLEELIRAVAEGTTDALPDTVLGMVQARLDALGSDAKRVLKAASVFGAVFWQGGVEALLGGPPRTVGQPSELDRLAAREVVTRRAAASFPGEVELVFRHALVREAAYALLTEEDRALAHRLAAAWLERTGEKDAAVLAEHHDRGGEPHLAVDGYRRAAEQALAGNDFSAAIARAERAIACGATGRAAGAARLVQAEAHRWRAEIADAAARAGDAAALLPEGSGAWFDALREAIGATGRLGQFDVVEAWAERASAVAAPAEALGSQIACLAPAAVNMVYAGRPDAAARLAERVTALREGAGDGLDPGVLARVHQMRGVLAATGDDVESALGEQLAALGQFERSENHRSAALARANLGFVQAQLGDLAGAEASLRKAHATAASLGLGTIAPLALHNLGLVLALRGELAEARAVEERAIEAFARQADPRLEGASRVYLSIILLAAGEAAGAEEEARRVTASSAAGPLRIGALAAFSRALLAQGRAAEAVAAAAEAVELLARGGVEEFDALARLALAEALDGAGDREGARRVIGEAATRLRARAARLRDPAVQEALLENLPDHARTLALSAAWGAEPGAAGT